MSSKSDAVELTVERIGDGGIESHHHLKGALPPALGIDIEAGPQRQLLAGQALVAPSE